MKEDCNWIYRIGRTLEGPFVISVGLLSWIASYQFIFT